MQGILNSSFDLPSSFIGNSRYIILHLYLLFSLDDLLGHPVLVPPRKRLILYQKYDRMTLHQRQYFNANVLVNPNWQVNARNHPVLASILSGQQFGSNAVGAFHFCNVVVSHFGQHLKKLVRVN